MSAITSKERIWGFTCKNCHWVPTKAQKPDYQRIKRKCPFQIYEKGPTKSIALHYPHRCKECEKKQKRYYRMKKRIKRIKDTAKKEKREYRIPKFLTFAVPSKWSNKCERKVNIKTMNKLLPKARKILIENGIKGGTYVIEIKEQIKFDLENFTTPKYKSHVHCHMVCLGPYVGKNKLKEFSEQLMKINLGRINYKAIKHNKTLAQYVTKYIIKDGQTSRTFGCMRTKNNEKQ